MHFPRTRHGKLHAWITLSTGNHSNEGGRRAEKKRIILVVKNMERFEMSDDERGTKPLLFSEASDFKEERESRLVRMLKARKWCLIFGLGLLIGVAIVVSFVATKSSSSHRCFSYSDSKECFFQGSTRLPKVLRPLSYEIWLQPNLSTFNFNGSVRIKVKCEEPTNRIVFHQKGLTLQKPSISAGNNVVELEDMRMDKKHEQVILKTTDTLQLNKEYEVTISFHGKLNDKLEGFYKSSYKTKEGKIRYELKFKNLLIFCPINKAQVYGRMIPKD